MTLLKNLSHAWTLARTDLRVLGVLCALQVREELYQLGNVLKEKVDSCKCLRGVVGFGKAYLSLLQDEDYLGDSIPE